VGDVLACFGLELEPATVGVEGTAAELLALLRDFPASADELTRRANLDAAEVGRALVELELAGLASAADGVYRVN
jgi:predicted Rossmann fold nucleotide-binding protein DprA/Smf involved in DNA uptake